MGDKYHKVVVIPYYEYERLLALAGQPIKGIKTTSLHELMNRPSSSVVNDEIQSGVTKGKGEGYYGSNNQFKEGDNDSNSEDNSLDGGEYDININSSDWLSKWESI